MALGFGLDSALSSLGPGKYFSVWLVFPEQEQNTAEEGSGEV
jgi:hypothetical protein